MRLLLPNKVFSSRRNFFSSFWADLLSEVGNLCQSPGSGENQKRPQQNALHYFLTTFSSKICLVQPFPCWTHFP